VRVNGRRQRRTHMIVVHEVTSTSGGGGGSGGRQEEGTDIQTYRPAGDCHCGPSSLSFFLPAAFLPLLLLLFGSC
jgi:hypothetical protein